MTGVVFLGPTLPVDVAKAEFDAIYLPPAEQGDIYRVVERQPAQIGIVDGYFDFTPSVWHKEILFALSKGIRVLRERKHRGFAGGGDLAVRHGRGRKDF